MPTFHKFSFLFLCFLFFCGSLPAQIFPLNSPSFTDTINSNKVVPLGNDENCSSFFICVKDKVKKHKHEFHSEHVYILEGEGDMILGTKQFKIKKGDFFIIPKGTPHAVTVTSVIPLKLISIQAPGFDGSDRVWVEE